MTTALGTPSLYVEGDALYDAMLADIDTAMRCIRIESYIFEDDEIGARFVARLVERARAGVAVTVRLDAAGSWRGLRASSLAEFVAAGVSLRWSRRWSWRRPLAYHRRNHRKLLIVDERLVYLGGFNIHRVCSLLVVGAGRWRDTHVRVEGLVVGDAITLFDRYERLGRSWTPPQRQGFWLLPNRTAKCRHWLRRAQNERFKSARRRLWLTTPYFVPDARSRKLLCKAARGGIDVRVLLPSKSDVPLAQWAGRAVYAPMLAAGVRVFEYQPRVLHAKSALVDDDWATVGSANFDYRSFFINDEANLVAERTPLNQQLAEQFERDQAESVEIVKKTWRIRPWTALAAETIGWWARRWL